MKIAILTYHWVANFGANLQTLSTVKYFEKNGHQAIVLNWIPKDLETHYFKITPQGQYQEHEKFQKSFFNMTEICRNEIDIAEVLKKHQVDLVIIGSDAVFTYRPYLDRFRLNKRNGIIYTKPFLDSDFPNPFWGSFLRYIDIPVSIMSASAQNTKFNLIRKKSRKKEFEAAINRFTFISVRDIWTKKMILYLTDNKINPPITPDPVFAFNNNCGVIISKKMILEKYDLQEKYVLFSVSLNIFDSEWIEKLEIAFLEKGFQLVALPKAQKELPLQIKKKINLPINPMDWYYLIKYSNGYIGELMHPILVGLHNSVPVFSIDTYGFMSNRIFDTESSKIFQILNRFNLINYNYYNPLLNKPLPSPKSIMDSIFQFDTNACSTQSQIMYSQYIDMMNNILNHQ